MAKRRRGSKKDNRIEKSRETSRSGSTRPRRTSKSDSIEIELAAKRKVPEVQETPNLRKSPATKAMEENEAAKRRAEHPQPHASRRQEGSAQQQASGNRRRETERRQGREELQPLSNREARRREQASAADKKKRKEKKQSGSKKYILIILFITLFIGIIGFLTFRFVRADEIGVSGNVTISAEQVVEASGIDQGMHVLQINRKEVKENIQSDPHLIFKRVKWSFPNKITIEVEERAEAACFTFMNTFVITDADGLILGHTQDEQPNLPLVEGITVTEFALGAKIRTDDTHKQSVMTQLLGYMKTYSMTGQVKRIDLIDLNQMTLELHDGTVIKLGQAEDMEDKFGWIYTIMDVLEEMGYAGGVIDVTSADAPVYQPKEEEPANATAPDNSAEPENTTMPDDEPGAPQ